MEYPSLRGERVVVDLESTGLSFKKDEFFGVAYSLLGDIHGTANYIDVRQNPGVLQWLADELHQSKELINHSVAFDALFLMEANIKLPEIIKCTQVQASLIYEHHRSYTLSDCAKRAEVTHKADDEIYERLAEIFGGNATRNAQAKNFSEAPFDLMKTYATGDAISAAELYLYQEKQKEDKGLHEIFALESDVTSSIIKMRHHGIRVDIELAEKTMSDITLEIDAMRSYIDDEAGFVVNPNPSKSIHDLFEPEQDDMGVWRTSCGTEIEATKGGKPSINADALKRMRHPLATRILEVRQLMKLRDTFLAKHVIGHSIDGRVYPVINQSPNEFGGTYTGRFSVSAPAMQQIPVRNSRIGPLVQACFLPDEDQNMSVGDFGQIDLRVCAHYTATPSLVKEYLRNPNTDMHTIVADIVERPRQFCKSISLGIPFGRSYGAIAEQLGLPVTPASFTTKRGELVKYLKAGPEAKKLLDKYVDQVPGVITMLKDAENLAKQRGFLYTLCKRQLHFNGHTARKAAGVIYQSGAADINKRTVVRLQKFLESEGGALLVNVHDSYFCSIPEGKEHILIEAKRLAENHEDICKIPIRIDFNNVASNWATAYKESEYTRADEYTGDISRLEKWDDN